MKKKTLFGLVGALALVSVSAFAVSVYPASQTARVKFSTTPVLTSAYVQLVSSLTRPVGEISVYNSGNAALQIALGAAGSEQVQLSIPSSVGSVSPQSYAMVIPAGQRVSVIALDASTGTVGELQVNFLFN